MKKYWCLALAASLAGCANLDEPTEDKSGLNNTSTESNQLLTSSAVDQGYNRANKFKTDYNGKFSSQGNVSSSNSRDYNKINLIAQGMMQDMITNLQYVNSTTPIGVTSFVFLDQLNDATSIVGNQLSESFVHEIHKLGIPVIEYKMTDYIRVTPNGDFALSRDYLELDGDLPIEYILTGTLVEHNDGFLVNTRIIGLLSKAVVGTAQGFIPKSYIKSLRSRTNLDGIPIR
jgi:TolB-like protein